MLQPSKPIHRSKKSQHKSIFWPNQKLKTIKSVFRWLCTYLEGERGRKIFYYNMNMSIARCKSMKDIAFVTMYFYVLFKIMSIDEKKCFFPKWFNDLIFTQYIVVELISMNWQCKIFTLSANKIVKMCQIMLDNYPLWFDNFLQFYWLTV